MHKISNKNCQLLLGVLSVHLERGKKNVLTDSLVTSLTANVFLFKSKRLSVAITIKRWVSNKSNYKRLAVHSSGTLGIHDIIIKKRDSRRFWWFQSQSLE